MIRQYVHPEAEEIDLVQVLSALSDPVRLAMVRTLAREDAVNSLDFAPELARSTVTHHSRVLREAGITQTRSEGRLCWISLRRDVLTTRFPGLLDLVPTHGDRP